MFVKSAIKCKNNASHRTLNIAGCFRYNCKSTESFCQIIMSGRALQNGYLGLRLWSPNAKTIQRLSYVKFSSDDGSSQHYGGFGGSKPSYDSMFKNASESSLPGIDAMPFIQGFQGREHEFAKLRTRNMNRAGEESDLCQSGEENIDGLRKDPYNDCYQSIANVSLHSVMQTNVPDPYSKNPGHMNMPGGGVKLQDKVTSGKLHDTHYTNFKGNRSFSTSVHARNSENDGPQGIQGPFPWLQDHTVESLSKKESPVPQGVQGMDCDKFKLWLANCTKYNLIECDHQLSELREGRKTLAEIFEEQEKLIQDIADQYQTRATDGQVGMQSSTPENNESVGGKVSQREKLKKAVSQYGSTVIVFHVGISLMSLGGFYVAVSRYHDFY